MSYRNWGALSPYAAPTSRLRRELDRLLEEFGSGGTTAWIPSADVCELDDEIRIDFELPGIRPDDIELTIENGTLYVSGERSSTRNDGENARYHMTERTRGSFFRSFTLPQGIDEGRITADFSDGVLHVHVPKDALPQSRRIQIAGGQSNGERREIAGPDTESKAIGRRERSDASGTRGRGARQQGRGDDDNESRREPMAARSRPQE
jgi:HSP20 family protein